MLKNLDWKYTGLTILLCIGALVSHAFQSQIVFGIKTFFELPCLTLYAGGLVTIITIVRKMKTRKYDFNPSMSFSQFKIPFEDFFSPITVVCSLSLAKGLFLQTAENAQYFPLFHGIDFIFIWIVTVYLLFISIMEFAMHTKEILILSESRTTEMSAITEEEFKKGEKADEATEKQ